MEAASISSSAIDRRRRMAKAKAKATSKKVASDEAPKPAAKKTAKKAPAKKTAKKAPAKKAAKAEPAATSITEADWTQIYAKAWADDAFRTLLETDPTAALKQYAAENGLQWTTLVKIPPAPQGDASDETCIHLVSCC
jgi:hypothetical protein